MTSKPPLGGDPGERCRLCGGAVEARFRRRVLGRHDVQYWRCRECGSLQTDKPTWLDQAYGAALAGSDVGAAQRCLTSRAAIWAILALLGPRRARLLDFGGGTGLLCRLLRDLGLDSWTTDRYGACEFAGAFRVEAESIAPGAYPVVTAFEVLEHLPDPAADLAALFGLEPRVLIATTLLYEPHLGEDWWYLAPHEGQHVFFYSRAGLEGWAGAHGWHLVSIGSWQIFLRRPPGRLARMVLPALLAPRALRLLRVLVEALPSGRHVVADLGRTRP